MDLNEKSYTDTLGFDLTENNSRLVPASVDAATLGADSSLELYYDMSGVKKLFIFNHFTYQKHGYLGQRRPNDRNGTYQDVKRLRKVFGDLNFDVIVYQDLCHGEIIDAVIKASHEQPSTTSCVAVAVLTHGSSGGRLCAFDRTYNLKDILTPFLSADCTLVNKPKLFFIQACRGDSLDEGRVVHDGASSSLLLPTHADFLILYSTVEDFVSWRDGNGSWLIQELCDVVEQYSGTLDLLHIITLLNRAVAHTRISRNMDSVLHMKKAMPETQFTLTKFLRF